MRRLAWIVALISAWILGEYITMHRTVPPASAHSFAGWLAWQTDANHLVALEDGSHLMAYSRGAGFLPSGPAAYVFDDKGDLVDWTGDLGGRSRFRAQMVCVFSAQTNQPKGRLGLAGE